MNPRFDARKILPLLAQHFNSKLIRISALSSLADHGQCSIVNSQPSMVRLIDRRQEWRAGNFNLLSDELSQALTKSKQALLFIWRQGSGTMLRCRDCGEISLCPDCESILAVHRQFLRCPICQKKQPPPLVCARCQGSRWFKMGGGLERLEDEIKKVLPQTKALIGSISLLNSLKSKIKTPDFDLVAVVDLDGLFNRSDFRGQEKIAALLSDLRTLTQPQTSFFIQTAYPQEVVWQIIQGKFDEFFKSELKIRQEFHWPPFWRIFKLIIQNKDSVIAQKQAHDLGQTLFLTFKNQTGIELAPPRPRQPQKIRGQFAWQIIIRFQPENYPLIKKNLAQLPDQIIVDIDAVNL